MSTKSAGIGSWVRVLIVSAAVLAGPGTGAAQKKPDYAPLTVEATDPPADMKPGDEVETTLHFRALDDLQRLEVSVAPFFGVEVVSATREAVFLNVADGDAPELKVTVRLVDKSGSLAVTYRIVTASGKSAGATTLEFGKPGN